MIKKQKKNNRKNHKQDLRKKRLSDLEIQLKSNILKRKFKKSQE
tara:strand:- start:334 stop:465 length:132 start_codon:yes stop_codon:yes gene_type:complete